MECNQSCEVWDIQVIDETSNGLLVISPNGDTQWMTKEEYQEFILNREKRLSNNKNEHICT